MHNQKYLMKFHERFNKSFTNNRDDMTIGYDDEWKDKEFYVSLEIQDA